MYKVSLAQHSLTSVTEILTLVSTTYTHTSTDAGVKTLDTDVNEIQGPSPYGHWRPQGPPLGLSKISVLRVAQRECTLSTSSAPHCVHRLYNVLVAGGCGRRLGGVLSRRADGRTGGRAAGAAGSLPAARRPGSAAGSAFGGGSGGRMCSRRALGGGCRRVDGRCLAGGGRSARLGGDDLTDGSAVIRRAVGWWRAVG